MQPNRGMTLFQPSFFFLDFETNLFFFCGLVGLGLILRSINNIRRLQYPYRFFRAFSRATNRRMALVRFEISRDGTGRVGSGGFDMSRVGTGYPDST